MRRVPAVASQETTYLSSILGGLQANLLDSSTPRRLELKVTYSTTKIRLVNDKKQRQDAVEFNLACG